MATETGGINLTPQVSAAQTATNYITQIDFNGIFISPSSQSPTANSPGNSTLVNGDGMEIFNGGISLAKFGTNVRIGQETSGHTIVNSSGMEIFTSVVENGNNNSISIAQFGINGIRIGKLDTAHVLINSSGMTAYNGDGTLANIVSANINSIDGLLSDMGDAAIAANTTLTGVYQNVADATAEASLASTASSNAVIAATNATNAATSALQSAQAANFGLSDIEKVIGTINWIAEHKKLSTDTTASITKAYYINSSNQLYYVQDVYSYSITNDSSPQSGTTYYTRTGSGTAADQYVYNEWSGSAFETGVTYYKRGNVKNPSTEGWYELDEAIQSFLASHL